MTVKTDRELYIGGSEANYIYMNYETKTFQTWWAYKLAGIPRESPANRNMEVGTILENEILDLYEAVHGVKGKRGLSKVKGIARANTDYILNDKVIDVKASNSAFEWVLTGTIPIHYRRQLIHYCYVFKLNKASILAYQVDDSLLVNPFQELDEKLMFEIDVKITLDKIKEHEIRLQYLEKCREKYEFPTKEGLDVFRKTREDRRNEC